MRKRLECRWGCLQTAAYDIYFDSVWHKHAGLLKNADKIDTLILGDSHAQFGIVPFLMGSGAYNYAFNANSLYETFESLKFAAGRCKNLKTVILMCSFYNGGYSLIRGSEAWHCRILAKKFAMNYDFSLNPGYDFDFYDKIIEKLSPDPDKVCCQGYDFVGQRINRSTKKRGNALCIIIKFIKNMIINGRCWKKSANSARQPGYVRLLLILRRAAIIRLCWTKWEKVPICPPT